MAIVLGAAAIAPGQDGPRRPHPAVVRVIAREQGGASFGSGTLVGVNEKHGLVVTNWHVVRDAAGPVMVVFPDGFCSPASVLKTDRDWDLAALAIRRPNVPPVALATAAPRRGEVLTIAGYGSGSYRATAGRCVQYVAPAAFGRTLPAEMIELTTAARNGDSGGPILNCRGEMAGVLFGSAFGRTTGSYCGRVRRFLASVGDDFQRLPPPPTIIAQRPSRESLPVATIVGGRVGGKSDPPAGPDAGSELAGLPVPERARMPETPAAEVAIAAGPPDPPPGDSPPAGPSRLEQIKTILAAIGAVAMLFHGLRLLGAVAESRS